VLDPAAIAALRDLNPGGDSFFRDLVQIFLDDSPQRIADIEQSLVKGDARQLTLAAHSLKGSSANFGAGQLRALSEQLELRGRQGSLGDAPAQLLALKDEFARVRAALEALPSREVIVPSTSGKEKAPGSRRAP
jgi:HPt (histidine-containing phosphotransfer) domain-containing protein